MIVGETGFTSGSVALTIMATSSLGVQHAGLAAGLVNTSNQLGGGFGLGIVATVVAITAEQSSPGRSMQRHSHSAFWPACALWYRPILSSTEHRHNHAGVE